MQSYICIANRIIFFISYRTLLQLQLYVQISTQLWYEQRYTDLQWLWLMNLLHALFDYYYQASLCCCASPSCFARVAPLPREVAPSARVTPFFASLQNPQLQIPNSLDTCNSVPLTPRTKCDSWLRLTPHLLPKKRKKKEEHPRQTTKQHTGLLLLARTINKPDYRSSRYNLSSVWMSVAQQQSVEPERASISCRGASWK
jgi:hypothetical protein